MVSMGSMGRAIVVGIAMTLANSAETASAADAGRDVYVANGCDRCHAVVSRDIALKSKGKARGSDLGNVGATRDADWLQRFLKREILLEPQRHMVKWKGSDDELKTLIDWLLTPK
jgi:cbb3-type cytochrome oxidase cytochrome c subunit